MKYAALLRGINVGGNHTVEMKKLKALFESVGCANVSTYINSGNVLFESADGKSAVSEKIEAALKKTFAFPIPTLVKTSAEMAAICKAIPKHWQNNDKQKTDVAYLFAEADSKKILRELPLNTDVAQVRYTKGALFWNVLRENQGKSRLKKIIRHPCYKLMTVRNVNTARYLASENTE